MQIHTLAIFITVFILLTGCEQVKKTHPIENKKTTPDPQEESSPAVPLPGLPIAGSISIHWQAPKKLITGEDIHDYEIKQYHISWGESENELTNKAISTEPSFTLTGIAEGDYYFSVEAESLYGVTSEPSATIKRSYVEENNIEENSAAQVLQQNNTAVEIAPIADQRAQQGHTYTYSPKLTESSNIGSWSKAFGPDDLEVHPLTGEVSWHISSQAAAESLHIGIRFQNDSIDISETWVLTLGDGNILYIGPDEEHTTLADGMKAIESGDTLIMRNGHWLHNEKKNTIPGNPKKGQTLPGGSAGAFTTLIAEDPGQVIIDGQNEEITLHLFGSTKHPDFELNNNNWSGSSDYISIAGLTLINSSLESIRVDYAKYVKLTNLGIGVSGEGSRGNSNVYIHESQYILIEGLYIWGHGRYKVAFQQSSNSIVRRSIARIDNYFGGKPIGGYIAYCSKNIIFQNNILIDSDQTNFWGDHNEIINAFGIPATNCHDYPEHNEFKRNLALNVHMGLMGTDARTNPNPTLWEDIVGWDLTPARHYVTGGVSSMLSGVGATVTNRMTLGEINTEGDYLVYSRSLDSLIENSIFYRTGWDGETNSKAVNLTRIGGEDFYIDNNNLVDFMGNMSDGSGNPIVTNSIDLDPQFKYITMLPRDSALHSMANDGGRVGAELLTMVGKSGTFYGEPDFNSETQIPMWPFPNENLAHKYLGQYEFSGIDRNGNSGAISGKRGFTTDKQTLTNYVWSYLENPTPPFDISITSAVDSALLTWSYPDLATNIMPEKFSIFELINSEEKWLMDVNGDARHAIVNSSDSLYTVRAILSSGLSSDYSFHSERHEGRIDKPEGIVFKESVIPG